MSKYLRCLLASGSCGGPNMSSASITGDSARCRVGDRDEPLKCNIARSLGFDLPGASLDNVLRESFCRELSELLARNVPGKHRRPAALVMGYLANLERLLPKRASSLLKEALFDGEPDAAANLAIAAPNQYRGMVAIAAYYLGTPEPAFRALLSSVWEHDAGYVQEAAGWDYGLVRRMFKAARFEHQISTPTFIYRGVAGIDTRSACKGISWTTSRDVACWFALRAAYGNRRPLVIATVVQPENIIFFSNERQEREVILRRVPRRTMHAESSSWKHAALRYEREIS